jgi:hypothetical protein
VDASNTLGYDGTAAGLSMSMFSNIGATMSYSKAMMDGADEQELTRGFYSRS